MVKQVNYILNQKQKRQFVGMFLLAVGCAFLETLGVSAILPFIQAVLAPEVIMEHRYVAPILQILRITDPMKVITLIGAGIALVYLIKNLFLIAASYMQSRFRCSFYEDISIRLLSSYLKRPYSYFITTTSSKIIQAIQNDSNSVYDILAVFYNLTAQGCTIIFLGVLMALSDPFMAGGILILAVICLLVIIIGVKKRLGEAGAQQREATAQQYKYLYEPIMGNKDIKVMRRDDFFIRNFNITTKKVTKTTLLFSFLTALPEKIIETVCVMGIIAIICIKLWIGTDIDTFIPQLSVFALAAFRILPATSKCVGYLQTLVFQRPSLEAAYADMQAFNRYEENAREYVLAEKRRLADRNVAIEKAEFSKTIEITNINWKYEGSKEEVLHGLSMTVHKGEAVALIGSSGAGKTTLADIILGLLQPQEGSILMDGVDIFAVPDIWSKVIGYVPQSVFLIDDTIRANVTFGLEQENVTDEEVWSALEKAQIKDYIAGLPKGLDTMVGERGIRFSGGQKQRIAIARALYHDPEILVLDEATSALDGETEEALMEAIDGLHGVKTLIIIAHRLSTIRNCDTIYEIADGKARLKTKEEVFG